MLFLALVAIPGVAYLAYRNIPTFIKDNLYLAYFIVRERLR